MKKRNLGRTIFDTIVYIFVYLFSVLDKRGYHTMNSLRRAYLKRYKIFIDCQSKRLFPSECFEPTKIKTDIKKNELAIVIQGLIETKDDFTFETVRLYKKLFPDSILIISTWSDTPPVVLKKIKELGCEVVLSKEFKTCGLGNVNYQICTSFAGIKKAKELGAMYVIKNRSDLRIYKEFTFEYLKSLLKTYPISGCEVPLNGRIVTLAGFGGQLFFPNWLQDFFYFGYTEDLYNFFNIPYDDRSGLARRSSLYLNDKYGGRYNGEIMCIERVPEVYTTTSFLSKYIKVENSVKFSWDCHKKYFFTINFDTIGALWNKYGTYSLDAEYIGDKNIQDHLKGINLLTSLGIINGQLVYEPWMEDIRFKFVLGNNVY